MDAVGSLLRGPAWRAGLALAIYLARCYAAVLFCESPLVGAAVIAVTLSVPNIGLAGLLAALTAHGFARFAGFAAPRQAPQVYNSLLVGLALGALYRLDFHLVPLLVLAAVLTVFVTHVLSGMLARAASLPVLSLPFVLVAWMMLIAAKLAAGLTPFQPVWPHAAVFGPWVDGFFTALGLFFFTPNPLAGLVLFLGVLWTSRYLAILALGGYAAGYLTLVLLIGHGEGAPFTGFNFMLTAIALGGVFTIPGRQSFALAIFGAVLVAVLTLVLQRLLAWYLLPVLTLPFLLGTFVLLAGLVRRERARPPLLALQHPALPEVNHERARMASARLGELGSVGLFPPFLGAWQVYQGFDGRHTHSPPWQHALDFFIVEGERSFRGNGLHLEDYHCFGAAVVAPASGQVIACRDDLPDNRPGEVDTVRNWGNFVQIRLATGHTVLLAHLRQGSLAIHDGAWVAAGQRVAACGNSGRSPQPHLHLHVQLEPWLGSPTVPFHLCSVVTENVAEDSVRRFQLAARPGEMASVMAAVRDERLAAPLHFTVGRCLAYRFRRASGDPWLQRRLRVELTLLGQFRLVSDSGASVAFEETPAVLACYDRQGGTDDFLDMWLLAMGLTPLSAAAQYWTDRPPARLLPLGWWQRLLIAAHPLGPALSSRYERTWDKVADCWRQQGTHEFGIGSFVVARAISVSMISPFAGCSAVALDTGNERWEAVLESTSQVADNGVPLSVEAHVMAGGDGTACP
jgi:urea transporter